MKKRLWNKLTALAMAMALVGTMLVSPMSAYAQETDTEVTAEVEETTPGVEARSVTSYYPSSGTTSGNFYGVHSSTAIFSSLPGSVRLKVSYAIDGGSCYIRFYKGTSAASANCIAQTGLLSGDGVTEVVLPLTTTYSVQVYYPSGNSSTLIIYGYRLYTE